MLITLLLWTFGIVVALVLIPWLAGVRYIPHNKVGIVEKFWSPRGSLTEGRIVALGGEAGFQAQLLRGGLHAGFFPWQYRIHKEPLVMISESKIGYVYARDGGPLPPTQTLARIVDCNTFQDAEAFLNHEGQRGRQRSILREGVFAINNALFVVITEDRVFAGPIRDTLQSKFNEWQDQLKAIHGFDPVVVGFGGQAVAKAEGPAVGGADLTMTATDTIGIVTIHDGASLESGEIIAPEVRPEGIGGRGHNYFQDPEVFLALGGRRGKQLQVLTDGTFFINRWFATVEPRAKTLIPIGYVGVVVSYYGNKGADTTGEGFRYGEQVESGERGVWKRALPPGKYPVNPYAVKVELVPTVNFVLRWITGQAEAHQYDKDLVSIELITADGYEPVLPLSLVLHIDYEKAPSVVQRFGDVRRLITQTLDPILTSYFRDVAQSSNMLDLLTHREDIQRRATDELGKRFKEFDINCIAVLIGRPESTVESELEDPIERLFDQLRMRRLAEEQIATFGRQEEAAMHLKDLNDAKAAAEKQAELTQTKIDIEVAGNRGEAQLAEAQRLSRRDVARAEGESRSRELLGRGEAAKIAQVGLAEAAVSLQKIRAYGDPRLFALNLATDRFASSAQPLVPERLLVMGGPGGGETANPVSSNVFSQFLTLLLAEKSGLGVTDSGKGIEELEKLTASLAKKFEQTINASES